jgi:hypothetical protein
MIHFSFSSGLSFKVREPVPQVIDGFISGEPKVGRLSKKMVLEFAQFAFSILISSSLEMPGLHERADSAPGLNHSHAFELGIDPGNGVGIDAQVDGKLPHSRQLVSEREFPGGNCKPNRTLKLMIERRRMRSVDFKRNPHCSIVLQQ